MFFFIGGITERLQHLYYDGTVYCADCGTRTKIKIAMVYTCFSLFFIPLFKWNRHFYVEFDCCRRHYELNPAIGMRILHGEEVEITKEDLLFVEEDEDAEPRVREASEDGAAGSGAARYEPVTEDRSDKRYCPHCGDEIDVKMSYCPHCGGAL